MKGRPLCVFFILFILDNERRDIYTYKYIYTCEHNVHSCRFYAKLVMEFPVSPPCHLLLLCLHPVVLK